MTNSVATTDSEARNVGIKDVLSELKELEKSVDSSSEQKDIRRVRRMLEHVPGQSHIRKYTTRDIAEGFVGGIVFSLPLLVEDGVFEIAEWFARHQIGPVPVFLTLNVLFIIGLITGMLYFTDFRRIQVRPLFGFIPKRLAGILIISFLVAAMLMFLWGRLFEEDPSQLEQLARVTVIWTAAALGATISDILPGESRGKDLATMITERHDQSGKNQ